MNTNKISRKIPNHQKPIEYDINLKYICKKCGQPHWLSFKEASTKNYKIVCDCDNIFKVKRVKGFKLKYYSISEKNKNSNFLDTRKNNTDTIDSDLLDNATKSLVNLGFTNSEAKNLIIKIYNESHIEDIGYLVKKALESLKNVK